MSISAPFIHFITPALIIGVNAIANSIGQGIAAYAGLKSINTQPSARSDISGTLTLGLALMETGGIISFISCLYAFRGLQATFLENPYPYYAEIGIALLFLLTAVPISIVSAFPVKNACQSIARQPFFGQKIKTLMLITQTLLQAPVIFAFLLLIFIKPMIPLITTWGQSLHVISAGLVFGLGSLGPIIGLGIFTARMCASIGINRNAYKQLLFFTFASEAIISSSIVFSLVLALFIINTTYSPFHEALGGTSFFAAALSLALATLGVGISSGRISAQGAYEIAKKPELSNNIFKMSLLGQALIETCALYGLIIAFMILLI